MGALLPLPQGVAGLSQYLCLAFIKKQLPGPLSLLPCGVSQGPGLCAGCCVWSLVFDELLSQEASRTLVQPALPEKMRGKQPTAMGDQSQCAILALVAAPPLQRPWGRPCSIFKPSCRSEVCELTAAQEDRGFPALAHCHACSLNLAGYSLAHQTLGHMCLRPGARRL